MYILKGNSSPCTGAESFFGLAHSFAQPSLWCFCDTCRLSVQNFRVQNRLTVIFRLALNLFPALSHLLKMGKGLAQYFEDFSTGKS